MKIKFLFFIYINSILSIQNQPDLFEKFPKLITKVPYISLCDLPTPIHKLERFGNYLNSKKIYIKRDDLTGRKYNYSGFHFYGGNKPRKLEFLLADALNKDAKTIITYGCAGSNHALATALYAKELGFKSILMLKNQPNSYVVRNNLLLDNHYNAKLIYFENNQIRNAAKDELLKDKSRYFFPTGGSNPIGVLGFVNAVFELKKQIEKKEIPEPDLIYLAVSPCSGATSAGLLLGIKLANLKTKIVAVSIEPEDIVNELLNQQKQLFRKTNEMLHSIDCSIPILEFPENDLIINKKYCGTQYGLFIAEAVEAIGIFKNLENIKLEGTYSAKPIAAIINDFKNLEMKDKTILFWNTFCGFDYSYLTNYYDYKNLPKEFHKYFEEDVQPYGKICN